MFKPNMLLKVRDREYWMWITSFRLGSWTRKAGIQNFRSSRHDNRVTKEERHSYSLIYPRLVSPTRGHRQSNMKKLARGRSVKGRACLTTFFNNNHWTGNYWTLTWGFYIERWLCSSGTWPTAAGCRTHRHQPAGLRSRWHPWYYPFSS